MGGGERCAGESVQVKVCMVKVCMVKVVDKCMYTYMYIGLV